MTEPYTRQSSFSNGDVIDAPLFNAEYDQLEAAFGEEDGHNHDGTPGAGAPIPFISDGNEQATGVFTDVTDGLNKKLVFRINGVVVQEWSQNEGDSQADTQFITHTPDGGSEQQLNTYLDGLEVAVGDAAADAAAAAESAQQAENAAMVVGVPVLVTDAGTYVIDDDAEVADVIFEGNGTLTLPTALVEGRRFYIHVRLGGTYTVSINTGTYTITGNIGSIGPSDTLELHEGDVIVLEVVSTTELEIL